jgi:ABC-type phosphate/phosphonate transport system permease subunit
MTHNKNNGDENAGDATANIFEIVDGIVETVNRTKKIVVVMLVAIVISIPLSFHIANVLVSPPYSYGPARIFIPFLLIVSFAIVGIRQWVLLSKWTKKYKQYKEVQKRIDEKFDFEGEDNN